MGQRPIEPLRSCSSRARISIGYQFVTNLETATDLWMLCTQRNHQVRPSSQPKKSF